MRQPYIYIESFGMVYQLTPSKWKLFLQMLNDAKEPDIANFGKHMCVISHNISDLDESDAKDLLSEMK